MLETMKVLAIAGQFQQPRDRELISRVREALPAKHPHLKAFLEDPGAEIRAVKI